MILVYERERGGYFNKKGKFVRPARAKQVATRRLNRSINNVKTTFTGRWTPVVTY